jgi:hypothetical protein
MGNKRHKETKVNVPYLKYIPIEFDKNTNKWSYELK